MPKIFMSPRKILIWALVMAAANLACAFPVAAKPNAEKEAEFAVKIKASILKLGTGTAARIELKLRDGQQLKGYVSAAGDDSFSVFDDHPRTLKDVAYPQVKHIKGNNLSTG